MSFGYVRGEDPLPPEHCDDHALFRPGGGLKNQAQVKSSNLVKTSRKNQLQLQLVWDPRYEAVSDQGPVWVQSEDKIPRASKSNFEVEIFISLVSLLP